MLVDFIEANRDEITTRYRARAAIASPRIQLDAGSEYTARVFIDKLLSALRADFRTSMDDGGTVDHRDGGVPEGSFLIPRIAQYGEICQSITELAMEMSVQVDMAESQTLDGCVDEATARVVKESVSERAQTERAAEPSDRERLRIQQELRKLVDTAILSFEGLRTGLVGFEGSTGRLLHRSLVELRSLTDRLESGAD